MSQGGPSSGGMRAFWISLLCVCAAVGAWSVAVFIIAHLWFIAVPALVIGGGVAISRHGKRKQLQSRQRNQIGY